MKKIFKSKAAEQSSFVTKGGILNHQHPEVQFVIKKQEKMTHELMKKPEVFGTGVGLGDDGVPILQIYVDKDHPHTKKTIKNLLDQFEDMKIEIHMKERFKAQLCLGI